MSYQSITFGSNGEVVNTALESHVRPNTVVPDSERHRIGITVNTPQLARFNTGSDAPATQRSSTVRVQLRHNDGLVKVGGYETTPEVAENLRKQAPEAFIAPAAQEAKAQAEAAAVEAEEISRAEANRHPAEIEGYHQHIVGEVNPQNLIGLMVYANKGETPPEALIHRIAEEMGEPIDRAVDKINLVNRGVQTQFTLLAQGMGLDADRAADWLKSHRRDTSMVALQDHMLRRNMHAWTPLLREYKAATGDGVRR